MYIRRKVYSDVDYDYGYDYDYEEPRYYSVIMDEDELALFSDLQEYLYSDGGDTGSAIGAALGGLGAAGALGGAYGYMQSDSFKNRVEEANKKAAKAAKARKGELAKSLKDEIENLGKNRKTWGQLSRAEEDAFAQRIHEANMKGLEGRIKKAEKAGKETAALKRQLEDMKMNGWKNNGALNGRTLEDAYNRSQISKLKTDIEAAKKANAKALKNVKSTSKMGRFAEWAGKNKGALGLGAGAAALGAAALGSGIGRSVGRD
jgi:predicted lipoprotein